MKETIIRKITSRKLWMALAGFVSALLVALDVDAGTAETVAALIVQGATVVAYIVAEGLVDANHSALPEVEQKVEE